MTTAPAHGSPSPDAPLLTFNKREWRRTVDARLKELGLTYEELETQAKERNFVSTAARKLWVFIGGTR